MGASPEQIAKTVELIRKAWFIFPELRLCQLLSNAVSAYNSMACDLYYTGDQELQHALEQYVEYWTNKRGRYGKTGEER